MGMYNEVYKSCPECNGHCEIQISQVVWGFGEFNLDSPKTISEQLDYDQKLEFKEEVEAEQFWCSKCGPFRVHIEIGKTSDKTIYI